MLLAFFVGHIRFWSGRLSIAGMPFCLLLPESCLAVITGHLRVGNTDSFGRAWISLISKVVRLKWRSFAPWRDSICAILVSPFAQRFILP